MNVIKNAAKWLSSYREVHASESVTIKCATCPTGIPIDATPVGSTPETNPNGVSVQSQHVRFIVKWATLAKYGITLDRTIEITWNNKLYRVAMDKLDEWEFNDPDQQDVIIKTVYVKNLLGKPQ